MTDNKMSQEDFIRKLTAIFSADVAGYSRLMGEDEAETVKTLSAYREIMTSLIQQHRGRVIDSPGDNLLAEFASVVDAVQCAVAVQKGLQSRNSVLPDDKKMEFRIGINLGDVIELEKRIYGDGVNIAARVEALADRGGISITKPVFDQVKKPLANIGYEYIGERSVKNIAEPIQVYRVLINPEEAGKVIDEVTAIPIKDSNSDTIRIAVLPFANLSGNREHDYFSRGFVEDLITDLSHFSNLQVISSYSSTRIGGEDQDPVKTAQELEIGYLLKGNIRRRGSQIRINTQLIASSNGSILWAERYDSPMDAIFDIQDDIVERVVGSLSVQIDKARLAAARKKPIASLAAYDCWLRGMDYLRQGTRSSDEEARQIFEQALSIDPDYSRAYAGISLSYFNEWGCQLWDQYDVMANNAYEYAEKAIQLDDTDHVIQMILGRVLIYRHRFDLAEQHIDKSLTLNSSDADNLAQLSSCKAFLGKAKEGEQLFLKALRLNPYRNFWYYPYGSLTYFVQRKYDDCIETALKGSLTDIWVDLSSYVAAAYAYSSNLKQASHYLEIFKITFQKEITSGRKPKPLEIVNWMKIANPFKYDVDTEHLLEGIALAGLKW